MKVHADKYALDFICVWIVGVSKDSIWKRFWHHTGCNGTTTHHALTSCVVSGFPFWSLHTCRCRSQTSPHCELTECACSVCPFSGPGTRKDCSHIACLRVWKVCAVSKIFSAWLDNHILDSDIAGPHASILCEVSKHMSRQHYNHRCHISVFCPRAWSPCGVWDCVCKPPCGRKGNKNIEDPRASLSCALSVLDFVWWNNCKDHMSQHGLLPYFGFQDPAFLVTIPMLHASIPPDFPFSWKHLMKL